MNTTYRSNFQELNEKMTINMHTNAKEELEVEAFVEHWSGFVETKNVAGVASLYSDDIICFDLVTPFQYRGIEETKKRISTWFESFSGAIKVDLKEIGISAETDVAFVHALVRYRGQKTNGDNEDMWVRVTMGLQKINADWIVKHMHSSVPFNMEDGRMILQRGEHPSA